jgi:ribosomal-protein-alanine N-acetyltransferase
LRGDGVMLRPPRMDDFEEWAFLRSTSRDFLTPWEPVWPSDDLTRSSFRRRLRRYAREIEEDLGYPFFVFRERDGALAGGINLGHVRRGVAQTAALGYWAGKPFAGQGLIGAGVRGVLDFAFSDLGLNRVEAACLPVNLASIRLLENVGFQREGVARRYLCIAGAWQDHVLYAILRCDPIRPPARTRA